MTSFAYIDRQFELQVHAGLDELIETRNLYQVKDRLFMEK